VDELEAQVRLLIQDVRRSLDRTNATLDQLEKLLDERRRAPGGELRRPLRIRYGGGQSSLAGRQAFDQSAGAPADRPGADRPPVDRPPVDHPPVKRFRAPEAREHRQPSTTDLLLAVEVAQSKPSRQQLADQLRARLGRESADALIDSLE
jgi:hypothetical protein